MNAHHYGRAVALLVWFSLGAVFAVAAPGAPVVLILGDSLSTGYGMERAQGWVTLLEHRLKQRGLAHRVVNASISGDTTRGGAERLERALDRYSPQLVVVELGGNDGLRGLPLDATRRHLEAIVAMVKGRGARVLLLGVRLPPNYGAAYTRRFSTLYADIAKAHAIALVPFFLEGVGEHLERMQPDGIHPLPEAQGQLLDNVWPHLEPLL